MIFRILGGYFNGLIEDEKGEKAALGWEGHPDFDEFPFSDRIVEGGRIILCDGELQMEGVLEFDQKSSGWFARIDDSTLRYLESPADGLEDYKDASPEERLAILKYETKAIMKLIKYYAEEISKVGVDSVDNLPELYFYWGEELQDSMKIVKDMVKILT